jgi:triacylglycerol lipase
MNTSQILRAAACCFGMIAMSGVSTARVSDASAETVVLLHGLGRTRWSMSRLASALEREGYRVVNLSYPSRRMPIETLAREWLPQQLHAHDCESATRVHFVTHSMGGIILRTWLRDRTAPENLGRVVMLAPPNSGSEVSDRLNAFPPFRWFTGVNGRRLGTQADSLPSTLGPWSVANSSGPIALGIIAGDFSWNPLFSAWLPGADDGKVSVASTHLSGERDHLVLPYSHTWLGWRALTIAAVSRFLREGVFQP